MEQYQVIKQEGSEDIVETWMHLDSIIKLV